MFNNRELFPVGTSFSVRRFAGTIIDGNRIGGLGRTEPEPGEGWLDVTNEERRALRRALGAHADAIDRAAEPRRRCVDDRYRRHLGVGRARAAARRLVAPVGALFALDMMIGDNLNIHLEATVARVTAEHIGFAYTRIPPDKEIPLWNLLGGYADRLEYFPH